MTANLTIHRLLDDAFAGVPGTPAVRDFKEELRANLVPRVEELESGGLSPDVAARRAFDELGDFGALLDDAVAELIDDAPVDPWTHHRVRYRGGFVVRAAILPILSAAALVIAFLAAAGVVPGGTGAALGAMAAFAALLGFVCGDALSQESGSSYPMPRGRAAGYGIGLGILLAGVGTVALCWIPGLPLWAWLTIGGVLVVAGIGTLAWLGATQTNRQKPWMREYEVGYLKNSTNPYVTKSAYATDRTGMPPRAGTRFETDPNAAARFGIYTMIIWVVGTVAAVLLGIFVGWWWSALPWVGALIVMMLILTRMLFLPDKSERS